jgi:preprotein translocase subunit Sec63
MVGHHADELLEFIKARDSTTKTADWVKENFAKVLASEMDGVTQLLRPQRNGEVSTVLDEFSLEKLLENTEGIAPNLRQLVSDLLGYEQDQVTKKKKDVVCVLCCGVQPYL